MHKLFKDILTGKDNETFDMGRVLGVASLPFFWLCAMIESWRSNLSITQLATGFGIYLAGIAAHLYLKKDTEPQPKERSDYDQFPQKPSINSSGGDKPI